MSNTMSGAAKARTISVPQQDSESTSFTGSQSLAKGSPLQILDELCRDRATGLVRLSSDRASWIVRLEDGMVTYANNSAESFERMLANLSRLRSEVACLTKELFSELRRMFKDVSNPINQDIGNPNFQTNDYSALCWLVTHQYLAEDRTSLAIQGLVLESIEPLFWLEEVSYEYISQVGNPLTLCRLDFKNLAMQCFQRLTYWQLLLPYIWSAYQRPYFFGQTEQQKKLLPELQLHQNFSSILRGFSFRHLATLLKKDELKLAASLVPFITEEMIILRDPQEPFDRLPRIPSTIPHAFQKFALQLINAPQANKNIDSDEPSTSELNSIISATPTYKVVCVDDSPTVIKEICRFLDGNDFEVFSFEDPLKAMTQMIKIKPDIILLDVMMPQISGYEVCKFLRKNPLFKQTPIVMITGNSIIDRVRVNLVGATDYLTKPFTQADLLKKTLSFLG